MSYHKPRSANPEAGEHYMLAPALSGYGVGGTPRLVVPELGALPLTLNIQPKLALQQIVLSPTRRTVGRARLQSIWSADASASKRRAESVRLPVKATKGRDGKVVVPVTSLLTDWNAEGKKLLAPLAPAVRGATALPYSWREKIVNRPLDAFIDLFDPVEDAFGRAIDRVIRKHVPSGKINWFGKMENISRNPPEDNVFDISTRNFVRRLRTIRAFIGLFFAKPVELAYECAVEGIDITAKVAEGIGDAVSAAAKAAGEVVEEVGKKAQEAVDGVVDFFKGLGGLGGYGGLGDAGVVSVPTAGGLAALATAIAGLTAWELLAFVIVSLALLAASVVTAAIGVTGTAVTVIGGGYFLLEQKKLETRLAEKRIDTGVNKGDAGVNKGDAGRAGAASETGPSGEKTAEGGISPLVVLGGAAALAFLFLRK